MLDQIIKLSEEVEVGDPIDFGYINVDEDQIRFIAASKVLEIYESLSKEDRDIVLLASMTKLVVENMVLNIKISENLRN